MILKTRFKYDATHEIVCKCNSELFDFWLDYDEPLIELMRLNPTKEYINLQEQ